MFVNKMRYTMTVTKNTLPDPASHLVKTPRCPEGFAPYPKRYRVFLWTNKAATWSTAVTGSGDGDTVFEAFRKAMAALWWHYDRCFLARPDEIILTDTTWTEWDGTGDPRTIRSHSYGWGD